MRSRARLAFLLSLLLPSHAAAQSCCATLANFWRPATALGTICGSQSSGGDLTIYPTCHATKTGSVTTLEGPDVVVKGKMDVGDDVPDVSGADTAIIDISPTINVSGGFGLYGIALQPVTTVGSGGGFPYGIYMNPTLTVDAGVGDLVQMFALDFTGTVNSQAGLFTVALFNHHPTYFTTVAGRAPISFGPGAVFLDNPTIEYRATSGTGTTANYRSFLSNPVLQPTGNGGTHAVTSLNAFEANLNMNPAAGATATVTTRRGLYVIDATKGGAGTETLTTQVGVDVAALTAGTVNLGVRNAAATAYTPGTQLISADNTQLSCLNVTALAVTLDTSRTLSSNPQIADGQNGQVCIIANLDATDTLTLVDGSGLNVSTTVIGPQDTIVLVYYSTPDRWIQVGGSDN